jgi:site-specific recombinase XerD
MEAGADAVRRFIEFFTANIRNINTRSAYARAVSQFLQWCDERALGLRDLTPYLVASYIEDLPRRPVRERRTRRRHPESGRPYLATVCTQPLSRSAVKQHLAAIRMLMDWLVVGQILPSNPASSVRGPRHVVKRGKTPVLEAEDARQLLDSIDTSTVAGLRDRALIAVMVFSFARVGAVVGMRVGDFYPNGRRTWFRFHEKGGKFHEVPAHHSAEEYLDAYLKAAGHGGDSGTPIFRTIQGQTGHGTERGMSRTDVFRMIKRRALAAGLAGSTCCHTFRATGITAYLKNGGTIEKAQQIAAHESPRTTKLYDRTQDQLTLDEIERIRI